MKKNFRNYSFLPLLIFISILRRLLLDNYIMQSMCAPSCVAANMLQQCWYRGCSLFSVCDQMFFSELTREASEVAGCFSSRVRRLLHLHIRSRGLQRYMWRLCHCFEDDQQILIQEGRMLLDYVTMNAIAIRKILKKYDKVSKYNICRISSTARCNFSCNY